MSPTTPRLRVVGGGTPSDEELAAITVALARRSSPPPSATPPWRQAALLEGTGRPVPLSSQELTALAARSGRR